MKKTLYYVGGFFLFLLIVQLAAGNFNFGNLFQGQLGGEDFLEEDEVSEPTNIGISADNPDGVLPDLAVDLGFSIFEEVEETEGNEVSELIAEIEISNLGPGNFAAENGFQYALYLNDQEIIANRDQAITLEAGDAFTFEYPISPLIYEYPESGQLRFVVDTENEISESDETNNEMIIDYQL